ncbi:hypothetical protein PINS_up002813 [Pythium insidiosum]|nr:hypothetical protein PINS_up002813 [Pythium insidiosum]
MPLQRLASWAVVVSVTCSTLSTVESSSFREHVDFNSGVVDYSNRRLGGKELDTHASKLCNQSGSFLGVGNVDCLHDNLNTSIFLLAIIIGVSLLFERSIRFVRQCIQCPQLKKIVNRIFEEIMVLGFISMLIFTMNTSGLMKRLHFKFDGDLSSTDRLHFYEFFHYIVFLTMIYFIVIVLLLLFIGTVVPKLLWEIRHQEGDSDSEEESDNEMVDDDDDDDGYLWGNGKRDFEIHTLPMSMDRQSRNSSRQDRVSISTGHPFRPSFIRGRHDSGMDLVRGSRAYALLLQRYEHEGWTFRFNLKKQWQLWKSFEVLAFNICQNRSGYIYKNPREMERLFGVKQKLHRDGSVRVMSFDRYHVLCTRNMLFNISHLHWSALFVLMVIAVLPIIFPTYDQYVFLCSGAFLLLVNVVIFFKVLRILRGIVDDRLRIISMRDIQQRLSHTSSNAIVTRAGRPRLSLRSVALCVRAMIRMQMSALCHRQLHYHDHRFWFSSPLFLLRLFHFATIGQAFYLVWFTLVEWQSVSSTQYAFVLIPVMVLLPIVALCVITPMTMPSLVLVLSLTGIFVDLNSKDPESGKRPSHNETKQRIRLMRRSYLRSHYTDVPDERPPTVALSDTEATMDALTSPATSPAVFLRMYDSPSSAAMHGKLFDSLSPRRDAADHEKPETGMRRSVSGRCISSPSLLETCDTSRPRRSFDSSLYRSGTNPPLSAGAIECDRFEFGLPSQGLQSPVERAEREAARTGTVVSPVSQDLQAQQRALQNYCSKYGGYPEV